jgi:dipeptidyl aminopeptidase/acylaminoacyl peptidase
MKKKATFFLFCFFILLVVFWLFQKPWSKDQKVTTDKITEKSDSSVSDTNNSQNLFSELTIPTLRERTYESSLGEMTERSKNNNYTTYLTSYVSDGLRINALLTKPSGDQPAEGWPAIVFVHGYIPPANYKTEEKYVDYINYLAKNGFVVFKIDLRGHGKSEGEATGSYYSAGYVIDTLNAIAALQASDFVKKDAIGLWGHSMSGNITLRSSAAKKDIPALVVWAGAGFSYQDLRDYGLNDNSYRQPNQNNRPSSTRQKLFDSFGQFDQNNSFWKLVAPTNFLSDIDTAIQLHHGDKDPVVSIKYSQDLNRILDQTSLEHEFYTYETSDHNIGGANFGSAMQRTVDFYKKHLK